MYIYNIDSYIFFSRIHCSLRMDTRRADMRPSATQANTALGFLNLTWISSLFTRSSSFFIWNSLVLSSIPSSSSVSLFFKCSLSRCRCPRALSSCCLSKLSVNLSLLSLVVFASLYSFRYEHCSSRSSSTETCTALWYSASLAVISLRRLRAAFT